MTPAIANGNEILRWPISRPCSPSSTSRHRRDGHRWTRRQHHWPLDWHFDSAATTFDFLATANLSSSLTPFKSPMTPHWQRHEHQYRHHHHRWHQRSAHHLRLIPSPSNETNAPLTDTGTLNIGTSIPRTPSPLRSSTSKSTHSAIANGNEILPADLEAMFSIVNLAPATSSMDDAATPQALSTGTSTALPPPSTSSQTANLSSSLTPFKSPMTPRLATTQTPIPSPSPSVAPTISPPSPLIPPPSRKPTLD